MSQDRDSSPNSDDSVISQSSENDSTDGGDYTDSEDYMDGEDDSDLSIDPDMSSKNFDPERYEVNLLNKKGVDNFLNEAVEAVSIATKEPPARAKLLLHANNWVAPDITDRGKVDTKAMLAKARIEPKVKPLRTRIDESFVCPICANDECEPRDVLGLSCGHFFCKECWQGHFEVKVEAGVATNLECMGEDCDVLVPEDFVLDIVSSAVVRNKYEEFSFRDHVERHPELRFCPGRNCNMVVQAKACKAKRVVCNECNTTFCFKCMQNYHAPNECEVIKKWLDKIDEDRLSAKYIIVHTKNCPGCRASIEKNGGCNHMTCSKCGMQFCWLCLRTFKEEGCKCNMFIEDDDHGDADLLTDFRRFTHYFDRWNEHAFSLSLEEDTLEQIRRRIQKTVEDNSTTWIDWQYLLDAAALLKKCRYTLQYTYPYAFYLHESMRELFEFQQYHLETSVERLSWMVERSENNTRSEIENQMTVTERLRKNLLDGCVPV